MKYTILSLLLILGCLAKAQHPKVLLEHTISGYAQGTTYGIKYYSDRSIAKESIDSLLRSIDSSMSTYKPYSTISQFNDPSVTKIKMDSHMKKVIEESFLTNKLTKGYFDITIKPLVDLWGFGSKGFRNNPTSVEVDSVKSFVGMKYLKTKRGYLIKKKEGISIDLNGIAQGYTVDLLGDYLLARGIDNYIVEVGGEIISRGEKPKGEFIVEVQRPYLSKEESSYKVKLKNMAITTSGTYEKQRKYNDKYISHHIDPKTGYPIENKVLSVTVIAPTAMKADAIDNYLMFISPENVIKYVENQRDMEVYVVYVENNILKELQSSGFNNYIYR